MLHALAPFIVVIVLFGSAALLFTKRGKATDWRIIAAREAELYEVRLSIAEKQVESLRFVVPEETFRAKELVNILIIYRGAAGEEIVRALEKIFSPEFAPGLGEQHRISGAQSLISWMYAHYTGDFSKRPKPIDGSIPWEAEAIESIKTFVEMIRTTRHWPEHDPHPASHATNR